jgi:TonB-linked SusC/RagA family outer membrane protein
MLGTLLAGVWVTRKHKPGKASLFAKPKHCKGMKLLTDGRGAVVCPAVPPKTRARHPVGFGQMVKIMKLTCFLLTVAFLHVSAGGFSQQVTLSLKDVPIEKVFREIERQTGYGFLYNKKMFADFPNVTIDVKDASIETVLNRCFQSVAMEYLIDKQTIIIRPKVEAEKAVKAADTTIRRDIVREVVGLVFDETGEPLSGASIKLKNGKVVAITDAKGQFKLKNVNSDATIVISFTGYAEKMVPLEGKADFKIAMSLATNKLDDVQVIAYGTTTERLNTGDVTTVTSKEIEEQPVSNPLAALEGRVPGLFIAQTTGAPGGGFTVQIRGQSSLLNGNNPFYVIDGIPYPSQTLGLINTTLQNGNPLNFINPADIESIEILKDADATSIYGSRAANGAILITTKRGKAGKMRFNLDAYSGNGQVTREMKILNTQQYLQMRDEAFANDGATPDPTADFDLTYWDTTSNTDWQKELLANTAHYDDAQASLSGGTTNTQYLVSGGYHRETSVFPVILPDEGADEKASMHFDLLSSSEDHRFKLDLNGSYVSDLNTVQSNDFTQSAYTLPPDAPKVFNSDGSLNWAPLAPGQQGTWSNPFALLYQKYTGRTSNLVGNALISYALLPGLLVKSSLGYTNTQTDEILTYPTSSDDPGLNVTSGISNFNTTNTHSWIIEPQIDYRLKLGMGIFSALTGLTFHENDAAGQNIVGRGFVSDALLENIQSAGSLSTISSTSTQYKYNAAYGRLNYNWQDKYLLNLTARRDGSSRFGPGKQFANFGAIGAAWIFSNESFFQEDLHFLSFGKIRASYGTSGNDQIGDYRFLDLYTPTSYSYQGIQGLYPANLFNPDLAWELDKKLEGGLELGFLKDRINLNASYFRNRSGNQLVTTPVSAVTGFNSIPANLPALVQNSGIEVMLNVTNIKSKYFYWKTSINVTIPRNKLLSFPNLASSPYANVFIVGQPITIQRLFHESGVNDTTGIYQFATSKGGLTYNPTFNVDNTSVVNVAPRFYGGFLNSFQWKGFTLDVLFQFAKQTGPNVFNTEFYMPGMMANQPAVVLNHWQKLGDMKPFEQFSQNYSGPAYNAFGNYLYASDFVYSNASFIRLKNLSLSYDLPINWIQKCHIKAVRVYIHGQNLLTITKYDGNDPENQSSYLPPIKVWTAGFRITL